MWQGRGELSQGSESLSLFCKSKSIPPQKGERDSREGGQPGGGGRGLLSPCSCQQSAQAHGGGSGAPTRAGHCHRPQHREGPAQTSWGGPSSSTSLGHPGGAHLKLQEGDVEEPVQVLEAEAVLHGGLSVAEVRGSRGPVRRRAESESLRRPGQRGALGRGCTRARPSWGQCPRALGRPVGNRPTVPGGDTRFRWLCSAGRPLVDTKTRQLGPSAPARPHRAPHPCWPRDGADIPAAHWGCSAVTLPESVSRRARGLQLGGWPGLGQGQCSRPIQGDRSVQVGGSGVPGGSRGPTCPGGRGRRARRRAG